MAETSKITTEELLELLFMESSLERLMNSDRSSLTLPGFAEYITALCARREEPPERVIRRADLEKSYGHQLFSGRRSPSRDTVLRLAFGLELDYEGTQELLKVARKSRLHPKVKRDMVLIYCLYHGYTLVRCQNALLEYGLPVLGEGKQYE